MKNSSSMIYGNQWPLLRKVPVLRFLIPFVSGILLSAGFVYGPDGFGFACSMGLQVFAWGMLWKHYKAGFSRRHHFGVVLGLLLLMQGSTFTHLQMEIFRPAHFNYQHSPDYYEGQLISTLKEKPKSMQGLVQITAIVRDGKRLPSSGRLMCYFRKSNERLPVFNDRLLLQMQPERIDPAQSPAAALYAHRQIYHRAFVKKFVIDSVCQRTFSVMQVASSCRLWVTDLFLEQMHHSKEAAIAIALLVGEEVAIDDDINTAYAATGTLHVLSVSGMHVGLIFFLLSLLCKPLLKWKHGKHIYYPLIMLLVWAYAFVAGAAPSIVRAAMMCMFFLTAKWIDRKNQGFGALGASLFIILLLNPFNLYEPGMQLSFFAVLGIIWLQRPIFSIWVPRNLILYKTWEMTSVSVAAQILTLPVSLLNFGQFPNYFMLANLLVIPITTASIYSLIAQVLLSPFTLVCDYVTTLNLWLLKISNAIVMEMKDWQGAVSHWEIYTWEAVAGYFIIIHAEGWLRTKKFMHLTWVLVTINLLTMIRLFLTI